MRGTLEYMWASAALLPNVLTIAGLNRTRPSDTAGHGTDDNVILAKLNDFYLGGVYISLVI